MLGGARRFALRTFGTHTDTLFIGYATAARAGVSDTLPRVNAVLSLVTLSAFAACLPPMTQTTRTESTHLTDEEIEAIPNAFPATLMKPKTPRFIAMYEHWRENSPADIGQLPSIYLRLASEGVGAPITVEECDGVISAHYTFKSRSIRICYELMAYANQLAQRAPGKADPYTNDVLMYVTLHEIGHALIHQLGIPIDGNAEDAADQFAWLTMTNYNDSSLAHTIMTVPAEFLEFHGRDVADDDEPDEHPPGTERAFDALCLLYGRHRDAEAKQRLGKNADFCMRWTQQIIRIWNRRLAPYTRIESGNTFSPSVGRRSR